MVRGRLQLQILHRAEKASFVCAVADCLLPFD